MKLCNCGAKLAMRNGLPINKLCPSCRKAKKLQKIEKHKTTKTYDKKNFKSLHRQCWKLMSLTVRTRAMNKEGLVVCYTCGIAKPLEKMHCGHYWHDRLDFDERNLKAQCPQCNLMKSGNLAEYGAKLLRENGQEWMDRLERDAKNTIYKTNDLVFILQRLKNVIKT